MKFYVLSFLDGSLCKHGEFANFTEAIKWAVKESNKKQFRLNEYESEKDYYKTLD